MNYIKKIFKNDKDEYISFPSTDDNITCENGQKLRDVLDNFTTDDLNDTTYSKLNTTNRALPIFFTRQCPNFFYTNPASFLKAHHSCLPPYS